MRGRSLQAIPRREEGAIQSRENKKKGVVEKLPDSERLRGREPKNDLLLSKEKHALFDDRLTSGQPRLSGCGGTNT